MRIKVIDILKDGDLECLTTSSRPGEDFLRVSRFNLLEAAGLTWQSTDEDIKLHLIGKEFYITPLVDRIIATYVKPTEDNTWNWHDIECANCNLKWCTCGDKYEPAKENAPDHKVWSIFGSSKQL